MNCMCVSHYLNGMAGKDSKNNKFLDSEALGIKNQF